MLPGFGIGWEGVGGIAACAVPMCAEELTR